MILRLQRRILQKLNNQCQRFLSNVNYENYLKDDNLKNNEEIVELPAGFETIDLNHGLDIIQEPTTKKISTKAVKKQDNFLIDEDGFVEVYTDGSCSFNGSKDAKAAIGIWFGDNHPLNVSQPIVGRSTCNVAEILAATKAVKLAKKAGIKKLKLYTDSQFLVQCITVWMAKWKVSGWKTSNNKPVINKKELLELEDALESIEVKWVHVSSHSGIYGNEMANILAKSGIVNPERCEK